MKILLKLLQFAQPILKFAIPYFIFTFFVVIFSTVNITLLGPLIESLFIKTKELEKMSTPPSFSLSLDYFTGTFNYYSAIFFKTYGAMGSLYFISGCIILTSLIANVAKYFQTYTINKFNLNLLKKLRRAIFTHVLTLDFETFSKIGKASILTNINNDINMVQLTLSNFLLAIFRDLFQLLVFLFTLFFFSYKLTLVSLILLPFSAIFIARIVKSLRKKIHALLETQTHIFSIIDETLDGFKIVKSFRAEKLFGKKFEARNEFYTQTSLKKSRREDAISPFSEFFGVVSVAMIVLYGGYLVLQTQELSPSDFVVFIALFSQILRPAKSMSNGITGVLTTLVSGKRIFDFLATKPKIKNNDKALDKKEFTDKIVFDKVSFGYSPNNPVIHNVSFEINKGETVALVGLSGSGKTTLLSLLPRFYDVSDGAILIDGINIKDVDLGCYRRLIALVTQETYLFNDTVNNNIKLTEDIEQSDVEMAAKIAYAEEFIEKLEHGFDTLLDSKGDNLSGGQKQRLSIARAIAKKAPILLFDEATASLDGESEQKIQETLKDISGGYTCLIVAHRLSTIKHAHKIIVIDKGEILEQGTHNELLKKNGKYKKLYQLHQLQEKSE